MRSHLRPPLPATRWTLATVATAIGLLAGCAAPSPRSPAEAPPAAADTPQGRFLLACVQAELPLLMPQLGINPRLRTRDDVATAVQVGCEARWRICEADAASEACLRSMARYGLGTAGAGPAPPADLADLAQRRALLDAAFRGQSDTVRRLLAEGAAINSANDVGWTPLMIAAAERHRETVAVLLAAGADPNRRNAFGRTALMFAAGYGDAAIGELLLDAGADPNLVPTDASGWTALMAAAARGHTAAVALLLRRGADAALRARDGQTAADLARAQGHGEALRLLQQAARAGT